jgi:DUF4097 and DUF4098 domain-containing protein YvlB
MKHSLLVFTLLIISTFVFGQEKTVNKTFSGIKTIRLSTSSGDIDIKKSANNDVKVLVKYSFDDDSFRPVLEQGASKLTLKEDFSNGSHSGSSSWSLEVPNNISISINTGSGDITVADLDIEIKTNSGSGNIDITKVKGDLDFNTGSGDFELQETSGELRINTGSGTIRAGRCEGELSFNAGSGNINLDQIKGDISANVGSGNIRSKATTLTSSSSFNSGSGDVTVTLATALDYGISVNSGSGNATLDLAGTALNGELVMEANKRNGTIVAPFKFDKEETIDEDRSDRSNEKIRKTVKLGNKDVRIRVGTGSGTAEVTK